MAVDLSRAVGWWKEWQLRFLVLGSLFLQLVLFAGSMVRNIRIPMSRLCIWLAYLGADALAIYALATLFNRHKLPAGAATGSSSSVLEVLWAPVLLIHLGGQHTITSYSIEDNELWRRHIVTVVSQVTVALYVFCKSWPHGGDKRLLQAAILLFVVGILKLIRKPWALKSASIDGVMTSSVFYPERRGARISSLGDICEMLCLSSLTELDSLNDAAEMKREEEHDLSLEDCVQKARKLVQVTEVDVKQKVALFDGLEKIFVDLPVPYIRRVRKLNAFLKFHHKIARCKNSCAADSSHIKISVDRENWDHGSGSLQGCRRIDGAAGVQEDKRWKVIQGVWVEMLCCSASSCRGYLHAKSMGEGMEFLTFVWLLLSRMGMETFADKFQRPDQPGQGQGQGGEIAAGASASEPQETHVQEEMIDMMA
ncbi:hypothetical protein C2845_PM03G06170 [Panicum miliaceum]|uniref:DUF4220 domain-containing protein n=1 Tax=Panicum miliaceum TaxID=4540 RepID=A0A3L6TAY9_PANMI|nr:hypothetical protein C2845_PM03G06170 [Panicum miliaceum]